MNFDNSHLWVKEKPALFGVKGRKAKGDENSCSFQKMPVGNLHMASKEDERVQVRMRGMQAKQNFCESPSFWML